MLRIHETICDDGKRQETHLSAEGETIHVHVGPDVIGTLPVLAVDTVMKRYGKPLADGIALNGPTLAIAGGRTLHMLRHRARYDVIARDFLVLCAPGEEPLAELATSIAGALTHLAR